MEITPEIIYKTAMLPAICMIISGFSKSWAFKCFVVGIMVSWLILGIIVIYF